MKMDSAKDFMVRKIICAACACILTFLIMDVFLGIIPAMADGITEGVIDDMGNYDARVKLRESPRGKVIGQYYAGTPYTADEEKDGWAHVTIGGRTGWMMRSYLIENNTMYRYPQVGRIVYPDPDGCISLFDLDGIEHRISGDTFLYVYGTIGDTYVHVEAHLENGDTIYGDCVAENISWTDNLSRARVRSDRPDLPVNVRTDPDIKSISMCKLYPGTEVNLLFDYHNSGDGWHRIRIASVSGYIRDDYLDFSTGGEPSQIPQWGMLNQPTAIISGSSVGPVDQADPLFILGITGSKKMPLYFCEGKTWLDDQTYETIYFYILNFPH